MTGIKNVTLGEVARFIRGITFKPDDVVPHDSPDAVWCMRTKNVQSQLDLSSIWAIPAEFVKRPEQYLTAGDLLVSSANSWNLVGKCCWISNLEHESTFGGFVSVLRADTSKLHPRYLYHWFSSSRVQTTIRSFGRQTTNISNLDIKRCLQMSIPLPPLDEQRHIAKVLDQVDALRAKRREAISLSDELTQSIFLDMFGDPIANPFDFNMKSLADWVPQDRPITYGILKPGPDVPGGVPYIRVVDMKEGHIDESQVRRTSRDIASQYRRSMVMTGDLLVSIRGHVGRLAQVPDTLDGANITQDSARLAVSLDSSAYVMACLRTQSIQSWMHRHVKGASIKGINLSDIRKIPIPEPPMVLQKEFAEHALDCHELQRKDIDQLSHLDELFGSLQQRAFRGELWED
ncbi:Type-1 restriction enzyme EcoKI specificity protein [Actinomadura sp. RB99]|uniref:restriction endonuclease subunit S n=1 Tax=Actinomadura sp. RB99 TaxID=2691577 RepID=UPI001686B100|nr:restriction endonuclease subunit S [Actinomadura sp. RB99]MBD2896189.1 Type-1 restriction enzyme EcoKI specificity protein [Actinomadura sp. RB99]